MKKYFIMAAIAAVTLASCSTADDEVATNPSKTTDPVAVTLSNSFSKPTTRAINDLQNEQIASDVQVGVSVYKTGTTATTENYGYTNIQFTAGESGALTIATGSTMYYSPNSNVDIYAYAPLQTVENFAIGTPISFSVLADQTSETAGNGYLASDLIWATPLTNVESSSSTQNLSFVHKLARVKVALSPGDGFVAADLTSAQIKILNTLPTTTFKPSNGDITEATGVATDITACTASNTGSAIVIPQTVAKGTEFIKITLGTKVYIYSIPNGESDNAQLIESGKQYTFTITVSTQGITLKSTQITAWTATTVTGTATN